MEDSLDVKLSIETESMVVRELNHASVVWKISNFKNRACDVGEFITSPKFRCSDASWSFIVIPNDKGGGETPPGFVSITLQRSDFMTLEHIVSAKFSLPCNGGKNKIYEIDKYSFDIGDEFRFHHMAREDVLKKKSGCLNNGSFILKCNMTVFGKKMDHCEDESKKSLLPSYISNSLCSDFEALYNNHQLSDVTLKLDKEEFTAHRLVLSARSKVFAAMFEHDMKENRQGTVDLLQMKVETVRNMLRYIYCGKIPDLSTEEALNLYVAADRYDLAELRTFCREVILLNISIDNACDVAYVADLHDDTLLIKELKSFLLKNGKEVIKTKKWRAISHNKTVLCSKMFEWIFSE